MDTSESDETMKTESGKRLERSEAVERFERLELSPVGVVALSDYRRTKLALLAAEHMELQERISKVGPERRREILKQLDLLALEMSKLAGEGQGSGVKGEAEGASGSIHASRLTTSGPICAGCGATITEINRAPGAGVWCKICI